VGTLYEYASGITDVPILGGVAFALLITMYILWSVTFVVAWAAFPILFLATPPYVSFNFRGLLGYRDKLRMLRKLYFPEVAVVADNGFVMHIHWPRQEGRFDVIEIDFSEALTINTQKTWTFGVKLVVTSRDGISRRFVLSRRFGRPKRLADAIVNAFVAHQQQVIQNIPHAAAQKRQQEVTPVHRHLPSGLQAANTMPIVICHTAETIKIAQTLETHLKGRVRVLTWNLSANRADTLPPQSCSVIFIADDAIQRLFASTHAQNVFVIPINAQKSAPSSYPELHWIDFSRRSRYDLGCAQVDYALMMQGVLPQPSSYQFDEHVALASALYAAQNLSVFRVPRARYRALRRLWWLLLLFVWVFPYSFIASSIFALYYAIASLTQSSWGIALGLLLLSLVFGFASAFLVVHWLQIYRYLRLLRKDEILPEVITVATDGVVCVLRRIWTWPFRPKWHVIAFKDLAKLGMRRRRLVFWRYYVHYTCKVDGKFRRLVIPSRFNTLFVAHQVFTQWDEYIRRHV